MEIAALTAWAGRKELGARITALLESEATIVMKMSYAPSVNWTCLPLSNHLLWSQVGPMRCVRVACAPYRDISAPEVLAT